MLRLGRHFAAEAGYRHGPCRNTHHGIFLYDHLHHQLHHHLRRTNKPWPSFLDGIGNGLGYARILVSVGGVREFFGRGSLLGFQLIPESVYQAGYMNNGMMTMSATARILVGCGIWVHRAYFYKENN